MHPAILLAGMMSAAPAPTSPPARAFVVIAGISSYPDREIPSREHAEEDARALSELLADRQRLGVGKERLHLLLGRAATRKALLESLRWLRERAGPDDLVLFAFFGQGAALGERGSRVCYLAADSTLAGRDLDALHASEITDIFDDLRSRRVCVLLDVSFRGFRTERSVAQPSLKEQPFREFLGDAGSPEYRPLPDRLVIAREGRLGPEVLEALRGGADTGDGIVSSAELAAFLGKRLKEKQPAIHVYRGDGPPFPLVFNPALPRKPAAVTPLPRAQAEKYATKILELCEIIQEEHVLRPAIDRLLIDGIVGLHQRLRQPVPADLAQELGKQKKLNKEERKQLLADVRQRLGQREDLADGKDVAWMVQEMLWRLDRSSDYHRRDVIVCGLSPQLYGIGLVLRKSAVTDWLEVVTPVPGGPAHGAGVLSGDVITSITVLVDREGGPLENQTPASTRRLSLEEIASLLLGKEGTAVRLSIQRSGEERPRRIDVIRAGVKRETVHGWRRNRDGSWDHWIDQKTKIAYLRIDQFTRTTGREAQTELQRLHRQGIQGLVLDLRYNPGGLLQAAVDVAALLLEPGAQMERPVFRGRGGSNDRAWGCVPQNLLPGIPLVVLVNTESAVASEMVAACLQDSKRAVIAGERSRGRAGVLNCIPHEGGELILTAHIFMGPGGKTWHSWQPGQGGVVPSRGFEVPLTRKQREELKERLQNSEILPRADRPAADPYAGFRDVQLEKALDHLRRSARK